MLSACTTVVRTTLPASKCFTEMVDASGLDEPTPHAPVPREPTAGAWVEYGNAEGGQLDKSNADKKAIVGIGKTCNKWAEEAVKKTEKKPWWKIF